MERALCQKWSVIRENAPTVPGGFSLHRTTADLIKYVKAHWDEQPSDPPPMYRAPEGKPYWVELTPALTPVLLMGRLAAGLATLPNPAADQTEPPPPPRDLWTEGAEAMREQIAQFYEHTLALGNGYVDPDEPDFIRSIPLPERIHA